MAERGGSTVTMFVIDVSRSMGHIRDVQLDDAPNGDMRIVELTNLEWSIQYVKIKIQEMIYNGRKTDQCGVILFGTKQTKNKVNARDGGYEHVTEFISIAQPNAGTLAKLATLQPSPSSVGDPVDALIVAIETQNAYLASKKTWTRHMVLLTDGQNPIETEDWEHTANKLNELKVRLTVIGVDFDSQELPFEEENKSDTKRKNEAFYHEFISRLDQGDIGNCELALREVSRPEIKKVKSTLMSQELRLGDPEKYPNEGITISIKNSKCTAQARPKSWKPFAKREKDVTGGVGGVGPAVKMDVGEGREEEMVAYAELKRRLEYYVAKQEPGGGEDADAGSVVPAAGETDDEDEDEGDGDEDGYRRGEGTSLSDEKKFKKASRRVEKEELVRGYKYGATFVPCADGGFPRLPTKKGIDICGFFKAKYFRRELAMGEVQYIYGDPDLGMSKLVVSSLVRAMDEKGTMAFGRWVTKDGMDPKMGVLYPCSTDEIDYFLWVQMPFADDVRKYTFASLDNLTTRRGEKITKHAYIPTEQQQDAMDKFVDALDLMECGEKNEEGIRTPWFNTVDSYNPAIHRIKQAQFHAGVVYNLNTHLLPPPHPELTKFFEPPRRVMRKAYPVIEECKQSFSVKKVPKKIARVRKDEHVRALDRDDDEMILLDQVSKRHGLGRTQTQTQQQGQASTAATAAIGNNGRSQVGTQKQTQKRGRKNDHSSDESGTEEEEMVVDGGGDGDEEMLLDRVGPSHKTAQKPTNPIKNEDQDHDQTAKAEEEEEDDDDLQIPVDPQRPPGRIIGRTSPLADFKKNILAGDIVTKAVEDLGWMVIDIVKKPFATRRFGELKECLVEMRKVAREEDETEAWNDFLRKLRRVCMDEEPGNEYFWTEVQGLGRDISLISTTETGKRRRLDQNGRSHAVSEAEAAKFIQE